MLFCSNRYLPVLTLLWLCGGVLLSHAQNSVLITEFMASNSTILEDSDGDTPDWVEIHNAGASTVNLLGYYLTDTRSNLRKWRFPAIDVQPDGYLVVFASDKYRALPCTQLHANFKLAADGGYLALVNPEGEIISEFAPEYPPQRADVSYGTDSSDPSQVGYLRSPTPGAANSPHETGFAPDVEFGRGGGHFLEPFELSLSVPAGHSGVDIRYTLDGTVPSKASLSYTEPIGISNSVLMRVRAFQADRLPGRTQTEAFFLMASNVWEFSSDLPIAILHTFGLPFPGRATFVNSYFEIIEPTGERAYLTNAPTIRSRVGIQNHGSSTGGQAKHNVRLEFRAEDDDDKDVSVLGLPVESDFLMYAPNNFDPIEIHNPYAYELSRRMGRYAPRTRFVELYLSVSKPNGPISTAEYHGLYVFQENNKLSPERVNEPRPENDDLEFPEVTGGYLMKIDRSSPGDGNFITSGGQGFGLMNPSGVELRSPQRKPQLDYLTTYLDEMEKVLPPAPNFADPELGYATFIDQDAAIDYHIHNVFTFNVDAFVLSAYFYKAREGKLIFGPAWDYDRALGSTDGRDGNPRVWALFGRAWWARLFQDIDFWQMWIDRWQELRRDEFSIPNLHGLVDDQTDEIREAVARDYVRWVGWINPRVTFDDEIVHLKNWLSNRVDFIDREFQPAPQFSHTGGLIEPGLELRITGSGFGQTYYTMDGTDPRAPGGDIAPQAIAYNRNVTLTTNARVMARVLNLAHKNRTGSGDPPLSSPWSGPFTATFVVEMPPLAVTEVMYHPPNSPPSNPYQEDEFEYIVLQNVGATRLDLRGFRFVEGIEFDFANSAITHLEPGSRVTLVENLTAFRTRYTADNVAGEYSGKLANSTERLVLLGPLDEPVADFTYLDTWHPITDGGGHALRRKNPGTTGYDDVATWEFGLPSFESAGVGAAAPVITMQPMSQSVFAYTDVAFRVEAEGTGELHYQWQFNGENLPGETQSTLVVPGVEAPNGGDYAVTVFDAFHAVASETALLDITYPAIIFEQPVDTTVVAGNSASVSVDACSDGPLTYQWRHEGEDLLNETNSTLSLPGIQPVNEGAYTVLITAELGAVVSQPAQVRVLLRPAFLEQPQSRTVVAGDSVSFTVQMGGTAPFGYRWRRNGRTVVGFEEGTPTLVLTNVQPENAGRYNVVVTNEAVLFGVLSRTANLTVLADTDADRIPDEWETANGMDPEDEADANVDSDGDGMTALEEYLAGTDPDDDQSYLKLEDPIVTSGEASLQFLAYSNRAYSIEWKESVDYGKWRKLGSVTAESTNRFEWFDDPYPLIDGRLYRLVAPPQPDSPPGPLLLRSPRSTLFDVGDDAEFDVFALGTGDLNYRWRLNGELIPEADSAKLVLTDVRFADMGLYAVEVSDDLGTTTNQPPAILAVRPQIIVPPQSQSVTAGETVNFSVTADGRAPVSYRWLRDGSTLPGETNPTLTLPNVQPIDAGRYRVTVSHETPLGRVGSASAEAVLKVE